MTAAISSARENGPTSSMSAASLIYVVISTGVVANHIVFIDAIPDDVMTLKVSEPLRIERFKSVGTNHEAHCNHPVNHFFHYTTLFLVIPLIVLINILVLLTVGLIRRLHTPHDVMVAASSLMDLLVGVVYLPVDVYLHYDSTFVWRTRGSCEFIYISTVTFSVSLTSYVLMSLERWAGVMFPFWYQKNVTCREVAVVAALVLCTEIVLELVLVEMVMQFDDTLLLSERCEVHNNFPDWYLSLLQPIIISTKLLLSLALNIHVNIIARKHRKIVKPALTSKSVPFMERNSVIPIVCTFLFIILWVPKLIFESVNHPDMYITSVRTVEFVFETLLVSNSFVNPLLICSMKPLYRNSFKTILSTPPWKLGSLRHQLRMKTNQRCFTASQYSKAAPTPLTSSHSSEILKSTRHGWDFSNTQR